MSSDCFICGESCVDVKMDKNCGGRDNPSSALLCQILNLTPGQMDRNFNEQLSQVRYCFQCLDRTERTRLILEELKVLEKELLDHKYDLETKFLQHYEQIRQNQNENDLNISGVNINEFKLKIGREVKEASMMKTFKNVITKQIHGQPLRKKPKSIEEIVPETITNDSDEIEVNHPDRQFQQESFESGDTSNGNEIVDQEPGCSNATYEYQTSGSPIDIKIIPDVIDLEDDVDYEHQMNESDSQEEYSHLSHEIFGVVDSPEDEGIIDYTSQQQQQPMLGHLSYMDVDSAGVIRSREFSRGNPFPQKKQVTGYIVYASEVRKFVTAKNPSASFGEISRAVGIDWRKLPPVEKLVYQEKADRINEKKRLEWEGGRQEKPKPILDIRQRTLLLKKNPHWIFECLWGGCEWQFEDALDLIEHCVQEPHGHVPTVFKFSDPNNGEFNCSWKNCQRLGKGAAPFPSLLRLLKHVREIHIFKGNGRIVPPLYRSNKIVLCKDPTRKQPLSQAARSSEIRSLMSS